MTFRNGLASLLRPKDSVLVLIDHQPYQLANLNSHDPHAVVNNSTALAKAAKVFGVPTILTSVAARIPFSFHRGWALDLKRHRRPISRGENS